MWSRLSSPGSWSLSVLAVCVQLAVKPCFLSGISVLTESIWALGELPSCWVLTCTHRGREGGEGADEVVHSFP